MVDTSPYYYKFVSVLWLLVANFAGKRRLRGGVKPDQHTVVKINYLIQFPPLWYLMRINEANKISDICNISIRFPISDKTMIFAGFYMDCNVSCLVYSYCQARVQIPNGKLTKSLKE